MKFFPLLFTIASRSLAVLFQVLNSIVIARAVGPVELGRYYYVFTAAMVGMQIAQLGTHASNTYFYAHRPELLPRLLGNLIYLALTVGVATGAIVYGVDRFADFGEGAPAALAIALCPLLLLALNLSAMSVAINQTLFNVLTVLQGGSIFALTIVVAFIWPTASNFLVAYACALGMTSLVALFLLRSGQPISRRFDWSLLRETIAYGLRAHLIVLSGFVAARVSVIVMRFYDDLTGVGLWSVAAQIGDGLQVVPGVVATVLFPALIRAPDNRKWAETVRVAAGLAGFTLLLCAGLALWAEPVITALFGQNYASASPLLVALLPGALFLAAATSASQLLSALGIPVMQVAIWLFALVAQTALAIVVYPRWGAVGLAWVQSTVFGAVCVSLWLLAGVCSPRASGQAVKPRA